MTMILTSTIRSTDIMEDYKDTASKLPISREPNSNYREVVNFKPGIRLQTSTGGTSQL